MIISLQTTLPLLQKRINQPIRHKVCLNACNQVSINVRDTKALTFDSNSSFPKILYEEKVTFTRRERTWTLWRKKGNSPLL